MVSPGVPTRMRIEGGKKQVESYVADARAADLPVYMGYQVNGTAELFPPEKYTQMAKLIQWNGHGVRDVAFITVERPHNIYEPTGRERALRWLVPSSGLLSNGH